MAGLTGYDDEGTLTIGGVVMNRPAWAVIGDLDGEGSLTQLWATTTQRGADRIVPGSAGVIPYRRRETATEHDLRIVVVGDVDDAGAPTASAKEGLAANLDTLESTVIQPTNTGDGTRAATLTVPGQTARTADIHVIGLTQRLRRWDPQDTKALYIGTLRISIPAGRFA